MGVCPLYYPLCPGIRDYLHIDIAHVLGVIVRHIIRLVDHYSELHGLRGGARNLPNFERLRLNRRDINAWLYTVLFEDINPQLELAYLLVCLLVEDYLFLDREVDLLSKFFIVKTGF